MNLNPPMLLGTLLLLTLASCQRIVTPLPLLPAVLSVSESLEPGGRVAYVRIPSGQTGHLKTVSLNAQLIAQNSGTGMLEASGDVYASSGPPCGVTIGESVTCDAPQTSSVGRFSIQQGRGFLNVRGPTVVEGINGDILWLGLRVQDGRLPTGTVLNVQSSVIP